MATYEVTSPDGITLELTGPAPPTKAQLDRIFARQRELAAAPKLSAGTVGEEPMSQRLARPAAQKVAEIIGRIAPGLQPGTRDIETGTRLALALANRAADFVPGAGGARLIDTVTGIVKGAGQTGGGILQLLNRLSPDPEVRAKLAEQFSEATPRPAAGTESAAATLEHAAEFALPGKILGAVERAPGLANLLLRAGATGGEVAGVSAVQQGSTEHLLRDFLLGVGLPVVGKGVELGAAAAPEAAAGLARGARAGAALAESPLAAEGLLGRPAAAAVGAMLGGGPGAAAGAIIGPALAKLAGRGISATLRGGARVAESPAMVRALEALRGALGPAEAGARGVVAPAEAGIAPEVAAAAERAAGVAPPIPVSALDIGRRAYPPRTAEFAPEALGLEAFPSVDEQVARSVAEALARRRPQAPAEPTSLAELTGAVPRETVAPAPAEALPAGVSIQDVLEATRLKPPVPFPGMAEADRTLGELAQRASVAREAEKRAIVDAYEALQRASAPGAKPATRAAAERAQARVQEATSLRELLMAQVDEAQGAKPSAWNPEYPQWSPAGTASERLANVPPERRVVGITPPRSGHEPVGAEVYGAGSGAPTEAPSLEALLLQSLGSAQPRLALPPLPPAGERAMAGGRSGTAVSPSTGLQTANPDAAAALQELLAGLVTKPKKGKPRLRLNAGKLTVE